MRNKIVTVFLVGLVGLLALEVGARLATRGPRWVNPYYVEMSRGFGELDALIRDNANTHPAPAYYDEFLYAAAPVSTDHVNFTPYYSARLTPHSTPLADAAHVVWTFGGSTMENQETTDSLTIANTWAKIFSRTLGPTHVKNFGTGGFTSSYELIKFQRLLREVPQREVPTTAIFYDGYNDAQYGFQFGPGRGQGDLSLKLRALVEHRNLVLAAYGISRTLSRYSRLWERTAARAVDYVLFPFPEPRTDDSTLAAAVRIYVSNVRMIGATCDAFGIRCFCVLQPLLVTKVPLTQIEQDALDRLEAHPRFGPQGRQFMVAFYQRAADELAGDERFIDASHVLNGRDVADFYDVGHTGALTSPIIGERIARLILTRMGSGEPP